MTIRSEIRALESHLASMTADPAEQIAIVSKAQSLVCGMKDAEHFITVMAIVKKRAICRINSEVRTK